MRRFSRFATAMAAMTLVLAGCGGGGEEAGNEEGGTEGGEETSSELNVGVAFDVGGEGDLSFNDSAIVGLTQAEEELGATYEAVEAGVGEDDATREERLRLLADQGFNPIIAVGFVYTPAVVTVSSEYPETEFAIVDGYATFITDEMVEIDNVADLNFAAEQGSFLVGAAAALKTKTKKVGFLGGVNGPLIQTFEAGFKAGVEAADPSVEVVTEYLSQDDAAKGFENPSGGETAGTGMYENGADVVYHAAGKSGLGLFDAVAAAGKGNWAIGVDSDQYLTADPAQQPFILTSMLKRVDTSVFDYIKAYSEGDAPSGVVAYDLASEGVGYATSGGYVDDIKPQLDEFAQQIIDGTITVPTTP